MTQKKKLIEVALPLEAINTASAREKSIRHGHPSTLHLWWARRPLAAARAVIFAQMVDDPSAHPDLFPTEEKQKQERKRLDKIIEDLVLWENTTNEKVLQAARDEIWASWRRACAENADHPRAKELFDCEKLPAFHDPFAGGGALPLEAQRLGLEAYASDLNPVAVLINKAMIEIPPRFAGKPPVNPEAPAKDMFLGTRASRPHRHWHSRGYLPHLDEPGLIQSITFRLQDSVPHSVIEGWKSELGWLEATRADDAKAARLRQRTGIYEDAGHGQCWLAQADIARIVESALLRFDGQRYRLISWCIMPNHVHVLIETVDGHPLSEVVHSWKSFTSKEANKLLGRSGEFWMPDYYDRFIRDEGHLAAEIDYMENNPVKAGLVSVAGEWPFSSASAKAAETAAFPGWKGAQGLAEDVRHYGQWMRDEAEKRIGDLYPEIEVTAEMAAGSAGVSPARPDLKPYVGRKLTVIAWLWARTVKSPNPAFANVDVPLASTFMLSTKAGKEAYVEPVILGARTLGARILGARILGARASGPHAAATQEGDAGGTPAIPGYRFTVKVGKPKDAEAAKNGTSAGKRAAFTCVMSGTPVTYDYIRTEAQAGRMGARLMAIVAEGGRGRVYLAPTAEHEAAALKAKPEWKPDVEFFQQALGFRIGNYGLTSWSDLFTPRQLVALTTFSDLVAEARERVQRDAVAAGLPDDAKPLRDGGTGAQAYAEAVGVYLAFALSRSVDRGSTICSWDNSPKMEALRNTFGRQAIPMVWGFAEGNPYSESSGNWMNNIEWGASAVTGLPGTADGHAGQADAASQGASRDKVVSTDPPYYDNVGYADLSDFFYVWLRRSLKPTFPDLFATLTVPKAEELVATPYRHGSKEKAETFFLDGMTQAMRRLAEQSHPAFPVTIYYAYKQSETLGARASGPHAAVTAAVPSTASTESETLGARASGPRAAVTAAVPGTASTGWDTFLAAVIEAGFAISGTWPMRTERGARSIGIGTNALASSIILVCRKRAADAPTATRREFVAALKAELPTALRRLQEGNIAPVDLAQAAIGPGMAVYTRYARVLDAQGKPLTVREALALINQTLDEALAEQEGDFDAHSRWALTWFEQSGFAEGEYGVAEQLSKSKNTSVAGMVEAGILESKRGKVRLLKPEELPADWDPATDTRLTAWEVVHHLIRVLASGGESAAAGLVAKLGAKAEIARELAYRLYTLCERKKRAAEALAYNGLVQSWPEIVRLAGEGLKPKPEQGALFGETKE